LRLLLDEMYSRAVAEQLRARGHDAIAVTERPDLRGRPDDEVLAWARGDGRAHVTDNVTDYMPLHRVLISSGKPHHGLVFTSNRRFPRGQPSTTGRLVESLDRFLSHRAPELAATPGFVHWLD